MNDAALPAVVGCACGCLVQRVVVERLTLRWWIAACIVLAHLIWQLGCLARPAGSSGFSRPAMLRILPRPIRGGRCSRPGTDSACRSQLSRPSRAGTVASRRRPAFGPGEPAKFWPPFGWNLPLGSPLPEGDALSKGEAAALRTAGDRLPGLRLCRGLLRPTFRLSAQVSEWIGFGLVSARRGGVAGRCQCDGPGAPRDSVDDVRSAGFTPRFAPCSSSEPNASAADSAEAHNVRRSLPAPGAPPARFS